MDEPLFREHEKAYFAHCYEKVHRNLSLDWHESKFMVELLKRTQKLCLEARIQRDKQSEHYGPQLPTVEEQRLAVEQATARIKSTYCLRGKPRPR